MEVKRDRVPEKPGRLVNSSIGFKDILKIFKDIQGGTPA
jgi:hypothetical protein